MSSYQNVTHEDHDFFRRIFFFCFVGGYPSNFPGQNDLEKFGFPIGDQGYDRAQECCD